MKVKQLTGKFPIFAQTAKVGMIADTTGSTIHSEFPAFYRSNMTAYANGFKDTPTTEQLNGVLNFITSAMQDLYTRGVPQFTLNVAYPLGAMVTFNGQVFISLTDDNTTHVTQSRYWGKVNLSEERDEEKTDDLPIGTILKVPVTTERKGYIDYIEGTKFNRTVYPELYQVLGTDTFSITGSNSSNQLPIGSIVHSLSVGNTLPDGFIEWDSRLGLLRQYPELKAELERMANRIEDNTLRAIWLDCLSNNSLPHYQDFYLGVGNVGTMVQDSIRKTDVTTLPVVVDNSNTLNPLGLTRCVADNQTYPVVASTNVSRQGLNSNIVVTGLYADQFKPDVDKRGYTVTVGDGIVTRPKTLFTRILVKATNPRPSAISSTHKQIIKAYS